MAPKWQLGGPCRDALTPASPPAPGKPMYLHVGEEIDGVDMRAEVGLLSRNIVVMGEMEAGCYPYSNHVCSFFDFDTFGGHIKVWVCLAEAASPPRRIPTGPPVGGIPGGQGGGGAGGTKARGPSGSWRRVGLCIARWVLPPHPHPTPVSASEQET